MLKGQVTDMQLAPKTNTVLGAVLAEGVPVIHPVRKA